MSHSGSLFVLSKTFWRCKLAKVKQICEEKLKGVIEENGYELLDVSYEKENGTMSLIFTIDNEKGVTIDDCEKMSKILDPLLDELNPTGDQSYTLVVSSPGIDRPLKSDRDLLRAKGEEVELNLFKKLDGKKNFVGILEAFDEKTISIKCEDKALNFDREAVASIKRVIKF